MTETKKPSYLSKLGRVTLSAKVPLETMVNEAKKLFHGSGKQQATDMDVQAPERTFSSRTWDARKAGRRSLR